MTIDGWMTLNPEELSLIRAGKIIKDEPFSAALLCLFWMKLLTFPTKLF